MENDYRAYLLTLIDRYGTEINSNLSQLKRKSNELPKTIELIVLK